VTRVNPPFPLDRRDFTIRLRMRLPSNRGSIGAAIAPVLGIARRCGCAEGSEADLEIALREALANAVVHGNEEHERKQVRLRCYAVPDRALVVAIRDEGTGFDPADVPDPRDGERRLLAHGRGLFLMRELLDHLAYRKGGREVVLYKSFGENGTGSTPA
jgi:serine/threonine-protein kinase RsbW